MSTYALNGYLLFPEHSGRMSFKVTSFSECTIESSWQSLTDTATIRIARKLKFFLKGLEANWVREGDPVEIWLGYNTDLNLEFSGYVTSITIGVPVEMKFEDEMYKLKRQKVSISMKDVTLKELLQAIAPGYEVVCDDTRLVGNFRFPDMTQAQCLEELRSQGVNCYFVGKTLHAMDLSSRSGSNEVRVNLERSAGESLNQKAIEHTLVVIELIRKLGKKKRIEFGDKNAGKTISIKYTGDLNRTDNELLEEAKLRYKKAKVPGLDGDITLFGRPRVVVGDKLSIKSIFYPAKNGSYYIDAVTKTFSQEGFRQKCKLGDKAI